ncbi:MAG: UDP-N-acetylmuramoyl-L-alanyl-D-glutamate--2,6-diaminopimelate ligase [Microthrixaceae bacterium]|nr:UDP-N-acetylmuramoyl-L-alanyl-D-glutamate--2,6-diaminopimelate ligase [Microthrixaceae bacterium]
MIRLSDLVAALGTQVAPTAGGSAADPVISDVTHDSRQVHEGSLFCCLRGEQTDGHTHVAQAVENSAAAILCEHGVRSGLPELVAEDVRRTMSTAAAAVWGDPSKKLKIVGVTGTNGKTTVVSMIRSILREAGLSAEMIGTLTGARTTPESTDLQRLLAKFVEDGVEAVAMEVSSHALVLDRVADVDFDLALFTNLGRDHLDFHQTQEAYFAAKALLFEPGLAGAGIANVDDLHGRLLVDAAAIPMSAVSINDTSELSTSRAGTTFVWRGHRIVLPMIGSHNVSNAILAASACIGIGVDEAAVVRGLERLEQVPGRFEVVSAPDDARSPGFIPVVDYAHTPDALETTLAAARQLAGPDHRVIAVFGCGGDRDREKRPLMGAVVARDADVAVVTSDNPRSEDPQSIIEQILQGFADVDGPNSPQAELIVDADRRRAIHAGLSAAREGDVVVIAGKGHESGQTIAGRTEPFDDRQVVAELLGSGDLP